MHHHQQSHDPFWLLDTQTHHHQQSHDPLSHYSTHRRIVINNHVILCHTTQHTDASSSTITWSFVTLLNTQMHHHQQSHDPFWLLDTQTHRHQQSHDPLSHYSTHRRIVINNHMILCHTTQHTDASSSTITWSFLTLLNTQTPHYLHVTTSVDCFRSNPKTFLFKIAFTSQYYILIYFTQFYSFLLGAHIMHLRSLNLDILDKWIARSCSTYRQPHSSVAIMHTIVFLQHPSQHTHQNYLFQFNYFLPAWYNGHGE